MTDMHLTIEQWQHLNNRVAKLEKKEKQREQQDIEWALCQFRYLNLTEKQREAFAIIEQALKKGFLND